MDGIRKIFVMLTKLERISSTCGRRQICSTLSSSNSNVHFNNSPSAAALENSSLYSKELMNDKNMSSLLEVTLKLGIQIENLTSCLKISPELFNKTPMLWKNCFKEVTAYGFSKKNFMRMVTMYPPLFKLVENEELGPAMTNWMNCGLGYDNMLDLLATQPQFLSVPSNELSERIPLLKVITRSSGKNVVRLLQSCPNVMYQDWRDVTAKVDYIEYVMKIDLKKENLSKCYALNRTLDEIQTRHKFLVRAGIYIQPKKVKGTKLQQEQQPWSKNPRLAQIFDTSDDAFISTVAIGLSLEELEVFREMYKEDLNEGSETEDD